jgi:aspartate-semialdehyde dehydrogenase
MAAKKRFKLGLVGTDSLRGREIKNILGSKKIASFDLELFDPEVKEEYSKLTEFKKEAKVIHGLAADSIAGKDLVFLASDPEIDRALGRRAKELGVPVIDLVEAFNDDPSVPLIVAGVNDDALPKGAPIIAGPHPVAVILAHVFHALRRKFGVSKTVTFVLQPASAFDDPGIQELASQSVSLLTGASPKKTVFKEQLAFNILSHSEPLGPDGFGEAERRIVAELRRVLDDPAFPVSLTCIQAPVFHTYSMMIYVELEKDATVEAVESFFSKLPLFKTTSFREACGASSISVSGKDEIFVGPIKQEPGDGRAFWIWIIADNLTRGSALNAFEIARKVLEARSR